jgi:cytochrome c-type biogenesis protein CcmH
VVSGLRFVSIASSQRAIAGALLLLLSFAYLTIPNTVQAQEFIELTPELDARAADLYAGIMCPICNGQTISQSHAAISETMRQMVRERLNAGDSDAQIYDFMVEAFGRDILASPPTSGIALAVWIVPPVAILVGGFAVALFVRRLRASNEPERDGANFEQDSGTNDGLEPYLRLVDEEMSEKREHP